MSQPVRRWLPGRRLVLVGDGGFAAVSLAWACVKRRIAMGSRWRWEAALDHPPEPQPPGQRGRKPTHGRRPRSLQAWASRADTPGDDVEGAWYGGHRKPLWGFSPTALWYPPGLPPVAIREGLVAAPAGKRRMDALCGPDLEAPPAPIRAWAVLRWAVAVTFQEARAHLGVETPRPGSDRAIARTTPVLRALFALVTVLALQWSPAGDIPVPLTAWSPTAEPTVADCWAVVREHLWRARCCPNSAPEPAFVQCPRAAFEL